MYEYIKGKLADKYFDKKSHYVVIDVNGIGYLIDVMKKDYDKIDVNQDETNLYTVLLHREDSMALCGFLEKEVSNLFNFLTQVSGVGPKMALNILNQFELKTLINCVVQEKEKELTQAKGVGSKLAQKIILELKDKFINVELEPEEDDNDDDMFVEVQNMLLSLQYTNEEINKAKEIVNKMNSNIKSSEELLREILKVLSE